MRLMLIHHLPVLNAGKSHQLTSEGRAGSDASAPQARMPALHYRVRGARLASRLEVRAFAPQKENQCQES